jgi:hypothetical protein
VIAFGVPNGFSKRNTLKRRESKKRQVMVLIQAVLPLYAGWLAHAPQAVGMVASSHDC